MYSLASKANRAVQPGTNLLCSESIGWTSALLDVWQHPANVEEYSTVATPDQSLIVTSQGKYRLESAYKGSWQPAEKGSGSTGAIAPLYERRVRVHQIGLVPVVTFHMFLPAAFFEEAAEEYRRAGQLTVSEPLHFLSRKDPLVHATVHALVRGIGVQAPDLYCNAACRAIATHLLLLNGRVREEDVSRCIGNDLTDHRLSRVLEYMQHHATHSISLDELAKEAGISRFHFVRLFKSKIGVTPHAYLVELRLTKAATLLQTTDLAIPAIAGDCGYSNAGRFTHAFRMQFGVNPSAYRVQTYRQSSASRCR